MGYFVPSKPNQENFLDVLAGNLQGLRKNTATVFKVVTEMCFWAVGTEWTIQVFKYIYTFYATDVRFGKHGSKKHKVIPKQALVL